MTHWILTLMLLLVPRAPYASTFPATAAAIDRASHEAPLYAGEDGPERTAALLVSLAAHESTFDPHAVATDAYGRSYGLFQVHESNVRRLHVAVAELADPYVSARAALVLLRESRRVCRRRPARDALAMYASGRGRCDVPQSLAASRRRVWLAERLLARHPVRWVERPKAR